MSIKSILYSFLPGVRIMCMHHLSASSDSLCDCVINKENFLSFCLGKRFVSLDVAIKSPALNDNSYVLTIDDGLADLYDIFCLTQELRIPISAFVSSDFIGLPGYISKEH